MRYIIEATENGYVLSAQTHQSRQPLPRVVEEKGGHGPLEQLYAKAEQTWTSQRPTVPVTGR